MLLLPLLFFPLTALCAVQFGTKNGLSNAHSKNTSIYYIPSIFIILSTAYSLILMFLYDQTYSGFQFKFPLFDQNIAGVDGISLWLIFLVNLITAVAVLNNWNKKGVEDLSTTKLFISLILLVQMLSICVFIVLDLLLFYISFEAILIPMYFLIGYYGSRNRKMEAQNLFFLYTLLGSLFLLLAILVLGFQAGTFDYEVLLTMPIDTSQQYLLWLGFFLALAIKMPMIPFHIWLPQAHTEAPTEGSVILAAILLKLGTYGFLRYSLPLFPEASLYFAPFITVLAIIGTIYSCISALSLIDLKQIIAYSSIAHMNVSIVGLFSNDLNGLTGCFLYSISHGFISAGLFLLVGFLYDRYHTRTLKYYRGLVLIIPLYVLLLFIFTLSNISFPGTLGFIAEMLIYISSISISPLATLSITLVSILLPVYFIWTFHKISFGALSPHITTIYQDLNLKEFHLLFPLLFLTIFYGIFPSYMISMVELSLLGIIS
jgi:proton-translocating NADH-quinone oxidoreductase chain M